MNRVASALIPLVALAACSDRESTSVSITGENGSAGIVNSVATIDLPNLKGKVTLPKFQVDADHLDVDGVKLYPGSKVAGVSVFADDSKDDGRVRIAFQSPAGVNQVREHFRTQFAKAGFKAADDGQGLSGTTEDGKPFRLTLDAAGADRAKGELAIGS